MKRANARNVLYLVAIGAGVYVAYALISGVRSAAGIAGSAAQAVADKVGAAVNAINPANPDNIFASGVNSIVQTATGDQHTTLGTWLYGKLNPSPLGTTPTAALAGAGTLAKTFGGDKLTREDQAWMQRYLYGEDVQAIDVEDAELGQAILQQSPAAAVADRLLFQVKP